MSVLLRLSVAIGCGAAAAIAHWMYLDMQSRPQTYVGFNDAHEVGQEVVEGELVPIPIPGDASRLQKSLIPYSQRALLFGRKATRDYEAGDIVFVQDLSAPEQADVWEVIGPFKLISVGARFKREGGSTSESNASMRGDTVTIAVDADFSEQTGRLLRVIAAEAVPDSERPPKIIAVQVVPELGGQQRTIRSGRERVRQTSPVSDESETRQPEDASRDDKVFQTVSLSGIPNVPAVLLEGDFIRFVVPRGIQ